MKKIKIMILVAIFLITTFLVSCRTYKIYINESQEVDVTIIQKRKNGVFICGKKVSIKPNDPESKNGKEREREEESKERSAPSRTGQ